MDLRTYLQNKFEFKKNELEKNYPGITLKRLESELENFYFQYTEEKHDIFETHYFQSMTDPVTQFFRKLDAGIPLAYISGKTFFYKSEFFVTPDVLIPRNETEILVEFAVKELINKKNKKCNVIDVGTGSGAIIISLLRDHSGPLRAFASDISSRALSVTKRNYFNLRYAIPETTELFLIETDRLEGVTEKFDLIVSNPPYIKEVEDVDSVHPQVMKYEPHGALFLKASEYDTWFKTFMNQCIECLHERGLLLMEGHENHLENLSQLAQNAGFIDVEVLKDYTNRDRFLRARKCYG